MYRGLRRGDGEHFLGSVVGRRVDMPRRQDPHPVWVVLFEVLSDFLVVG